MRFFLADVIANVFRILLQNKRVAQTAVLTEWGVTRIPCATTQKYQCLLSKHLSPIILTLQFDAHVVIHFPAVSR